MTSPVAGDAIDPQVPELTVSKVAGVDEERGRVAPHAEAIPWSQDRTRETARGRNALALLGILGFIIAGAFVTRWANWGPGDEIDRLLTMIFAPIIGLVEMARRGPARGALTGHFAPAIGGSRIGRRSLSRAGVRTATWSAWLNCQLTQSGQGI